MKLHIAIPVIDELEWLPHTLESISGQSFRDFKVWICVNQPESWWEHEDKRRICESNALLLEWLASYNGLECEVIDRSSRGRGWPDGKGGVGMARRVVMDAVAAEADDRDIIVSLDGDTAMDSDYLAEVNQKFIDHPEATGFTARYYHKLTGDEEIDRAILRYEIYMRCYLINLIRIGSPYAFTAMGSAMATSVNSYRKVGGMTPKKSAEDFYFLVKLAKSGPLIYGDNARVYPASRKSERVIFGTGQAVMNGYEIMRERYPVFECGLSAFR
jgi:cellulose synthase/poly-beta-1,6-N-acetylglucosamine synthase-like glycosyltransferase